MKIELKSDQKVCRGSVSDVVATTVVGVPHGVALLNYTGSEFKHIWVVGLS